MVAGTKNSFVPLPEWRLVGMKSGKLDNRPVDAELIGEEL